LVELISKLGELANKFNQLFDKGGGKASKYLGIQILNPNFN